MIKKYAPLVALVAALSGTAACGAEAQPTTPPPPCPSFFVPEWEADDNEWECEPDIDPQNGIDDEDDEAAEEGDE